MKRYSNAPSRGFGWRFRSSRVCLSMAVALLTAMTAGLPIPAQAQYNIPEPSYRVIGVFCPFCKEMIRGKELPSTCPFCGRSLFSRKHQQAQAEETFDITSAPIFVAPACTIVGVLYGGHWFYNQITGKYDDFFLSSYLKHMTMKSNPPDPRFDGAASFGMFIGGLPWVVLYPVGWTVKMVGVGVVRSGQKVVEALTPPDSSPVIRQYRAIADTYGQMAKEAEINLARQSDRVSLAQAACDRHLDRFIQEQADLKDLAAQDPAAAREKARKRLDVYAQSLVKHQQASDLGAQTSAELQKLRDDASEKLVGQLRELLSEMPVEWEKAGLTAKLESDQLTQGQRRVLRRNRRALTEGATWVSAALAGKELLDDMIQSEADGLSMSEWLSRPETGEKIVDLLASFSTPGATIKRATDTAYYGLTELLTVGTLTRIRNDNQRLWQMSRTHDIYGYNWLKQTRDLEIAKAEEAKARKLKTEYEQEKATYEKKIQQLR